MRLLAVLIAGSMAVACGTKTETADAGVDAGFDAGPPAPTCLVDTIDAGPGDAGWDGGYDYSCRGRAPVMGGQAEFVLSGKVTKAGLTRTRLSGIQVDLLRADGGVLATTRSDDAGLYRLTFDAGCQKVDGEVRATHPSPDAGYYLSYSVPSAPWTRDRSELELILFDVSTSMLAAAFAGVTVVDGTAVLALSVVDCAGNPVEGAVVSTAGAVGTVRYVGASGLPSNSATVTSASGNVIIFNLPGVDVDVSATVDGGTIGQRVVVVHPNAASGTTLTP